MPVLSNVDSMRCQERINPRTATSQQSIWYELPEDTFRTHLVILQERTNAVPVKTQRFPFATYSSTSTESSHILPLAIEQSLADDFAYIAAVGEGAQSVSAVCVLQRTAQPGLCVKFAAVDAINESVQCTIQEVGHLLKRSTVNSCPDHDYEDQDLLLEVIIKQHYQRLLGRLRSAKWQKPKYLSRIHKKSLWQDFDNLLHRVQFIYTKKKDIRRQEVETHINQLASIIRQFEDTQPNSEAEFVRMIDLVKECYNFCRTATLSDYATKLEALPHATPQIAAAIKTLRQIEKIGAYRRIACDLITTARQFPILFGDIEFTYLPPYFPVDTQIGYENWAKTMHVHAEIQLVVQNDLLLMDQALSIAPPKVSYLTPRVIGTSKYLCYLCYLFIKHHGTFLANNTHGRLYDQWTIPDLSTFDENLRQNYVRVIKDIDQEVVQLSDTIGPREGKRDAWRVEPMTSRQNLLLDPMQETHLLKAV